MAGSFKAQLDQSRCRNLAAVYSSGIRDILLGRALMPGAPLRGKQNLYLHSSPYSLRDSHPTEEFLGNPSPIGMVSRQVANSPPFGLLVRVCLRFDAKTDAVIPMQ